MKRLLVLFLLMPAPLWAQDPSVRSSTAAADAAPSAAAQPAQPAASGRRRPSMVGYVDDSTISTKIRVRFDAGYGMESPDRAEFFYGKCGCYRTLPTSNAAYDPNAPGPGPGVVTNLNFGELRVLGEYAPSSKFSFFGELPFRFLRPDTFAPGTGSFGSQNGIADLKLGAKAALISTPQRQLTAMLQFGTRTGDASKGLGTNHGTVEPSLLYEESPNDRFSIEAEFGDVIPTSGSAGIPTSSADQFSSSVIYYGVGPSYEVYRTPSFTVAPVVELVGWHVVGGFQTSATDAAVGGWDIVNLKFGARVGLRDGSSIYVGYGHALTKDNWYDNIVRFEYRMPFGR
jgi:hypothetical protein